MSKVVKLSPQFLAQLKDRGQLREWKRPEVISDEEAKKIVNSKEEK